MAGAGDVVATRNRLPLAGRGAVVRLARLRYPAPIG